VSHESLTTGREALITMKATDTNVKDLRRDIADGLNGLSAILGDNVKNAECKPKVFRRKSDLWLTFEIRGA